MLDDKVVDSMIAAALSAWDKKAGYSKIERMHDAIEAALEEAERIRLAKPMPEGFGEFMKRRMNGE